MFFLSLFINRDLAQVLKYIQYKYMLFKSRDVDLLLVLGSSCFSGRCLHTIFLAITIDIHIRFLQFLDLLLCTKTTCSSFINYKSQLNITIYIELLWNQTLNTGNIKSEWSILSPLVGFELRTSRFAVKLKIHFFEAFASPSSGLLAKLVDQNSCSYPPLAGRAQCGCQLLTN